MEADVPLTRAGLQALLHDGRSGLHVLTRGACYSREQTVRRRRAAAGQAAADEEDFFVRRFRIHNRYRNGAAAFTQFGRRMLNWDNSFWANERWKEDWERAGEITHQLVKVMRPEARPGGGDGRLSIASMRGANGEKFYGTPVAAIGDGLPSSGMEEEGDAQRDGNLLLAPLHLLKEDLVTREEGLTCFCATVKETASRCVPAARAMLLEDSPKCAGGMRLDSVAAALEGVFDAMGDLCGANSPSADLARLVARKLVVAPVDMGEVRLSGFSSQLHASAGHRYSFEPGNALEDDDEDCWMSAPGTIRGGVGQEWLEFSLAGGDGPESRRRVEVVAIRIPSMPSGPNAVKTFHLEVPIAGSAGEGPSPSGSFIRASDDLVLPTESIHQDIQTAFVLTPPVEASRVRVVFTEMYVPIANFGPASRHRHRSAPPPVL